VLYSGVACITDLMVKEGLINLDFADVRSVMREMGRAMMGTGEASGDGRAMAAAEAAIANPLLDETSMKGAQGLLISITGGRDMTLFEVDEAATRIREEVDPDANIILGATFDEELEGMIRVSVVATGIDRTAAEVADRTASFRPVASKPAARPAAPVSSMQAQPAPVMQQPAPQPMAPQPAAPQADLIAEAIRQADIERELLIQARAAEKAQDEFRPQSKLFAGAASEAQPAMRAPVQQAPAQQAPVYQAPAYQAPMQHAPEPVYQQQPSHAAPMHHMQHEPMAPSVRQPEPVRMPKVEDFPPMVKAEAEHRAQPAAAHHEERGPMGLLKRITNSLGRREEEDHSVASDMTSGAPSAASQQRRPLSPEASVYAPRRGALDERGCAGSRTDFPPTFYLAGTPGPQAQAFPILVMVTTECEWGNTVTKRKKQ
jgi:cell division protein FtsZ